MGLLNGISQAGATISGYAGQIGLMAQKADLQNQSLMLADQLQGQRESAGRDQAAGIAADAASKDQAFRASQTLVTEAGADRRNALTNAGMPEYRAAQTADMQQRTAAGSVELDKLNQVTTLQKQLADEVAKPNADPDKVASLGNQIGALGMTTATRQAAQNSLDSLAKTESANSISLSKQLNEETDKLGGMMLDQEQRARQQKIVDDVKTQLDASRARAASLIEQARGATGSPRPAGLINGGPVSPSPSAVSPATAPASVSPAAGDASPSAPTGSPFDAPISPAASAAATGAPAVTSSTAATVSGALPGDLTSVKSLDDVKKLRPELNVDALRGRNPMLVSRVLSIVDGRATFPTGRTPDANAIISLANTVDPTLDEASVKGRMATRQAFSSGVEAKNITAINTALGHAGVVADAFDKLDNRGIPAWNSAGNAIKTAFGYGDFQSAEVAVNALAAEARKVFAGSSGGNLTELKEWQDSFPLNGSPTQQKAALNQFVGLLQSRLDSLSDQYNRGMGVTRDPTTFLEPKALSVYRRLTGTEPSTIPATQLGNSNGFSPAPTTVPRSAPASPAATRSDPMAAARAAIAAGAPRDAVIARLKANGIDPSSLDSSSMLNALPSAGQD